MSGIHDSAGAYAADALTGAERAEFEAHLATCPACQREVREFAETAAELSRYTAVPPPPELRTSVLDAIRAESRPEPVATPAVTARPAPADELAARRARRPRRWLELAAAAAVVVALALGGWVYALHREQQNQVSTATLESQLLSAPDVKTYHAAVAGRSISFVVSKQLNRAMFTSTDLPSPGENKTYQLWTIDAGGAHPAGLVSGGTQKVFLSGPVRSAAAVAISLEPSGGSTIPTQVLTAQKL